MQILKAVAMGVRRLNWFGQISPTNPAIAVDCTVELV
jgi:hypothetical protein